MNFFLENQLNRTNVHLVASRLVFGEAFGIINYINLKSNDVEISATTQKVFTSKGKPKKSQQENSFIVILCQNKLPTTQKMKKIFGDIVADSLKMILKKIYKLYFKGFFC